MREIKFRGKSVDDCWVYGGLAITSAGLAYISPNSLQATEVKRSTVGQYTGLKDIDGKEIYEGDIVTADELLFECDVKIKGNIHEDPHLLNV